jgi:hypothetical protein
MTDLAAHYLEEVKRQHRGHKRMGEAAFKARHPTGYRQGTYETKA